jgi:hypothetical protein
VGFVGRSCVLLGFALCICGVVCPQLHSFWVVWYFCTVTRFLGVVNTFVLNCLGFEFFGGRGRREGVGSVYLLGSVLGLNVMRTISTVVAHFLHTEGVTSSNLVSSMLKPSLAGGFVVSMPFGVCPLLCELGQSWTASYRQALPIHTPIFGMDLV